MPTPVVLAGAKIPRYKRVYIKKNWGDKFVFQSRIKPKRITRAVSPEIGEADLTVFFGPNVQPVGLPLGAYPPFDINGYYILITSVPLLWDGQPPTANPDPDKENFDFVGVIEDTETQPRSSTELNGIQRFKAYTLERLLERTIIERSIAKNDGGIEFTIHFAPPFNMRNPFLQKHEQQLDVDTKKLLGNADETKKVFSHERMWTARDVIKYLLTNFAPKPIPWDWDTSKGQHDSLDQFVDIWPQQGLSIKTIMDSIINRKKGYTWYVETDGSKYANIRVSTMFGTAFVQGDKTIPANNRQIVYTVATAIPDRHIFGPPQFRYSDLNRVDRVVIQAQCIKLAGTIGVLDSNLIKGWIATQETRYRNVSPTDANKADYLRQQSKFERVFTHFVLPRYGNSRWLGFLGDGQGGPQLVAVPTVNDDGTVTWGITPGNLWTPSVRFESLLPLQEGYDWSTGIDDPLFNLNDPDTDPEYRKPLVLLRDPVDNHFMVAEYMHMKQPYLHPASVTVLQKEAGLRIQCSPAHHLAGNPNSDYIPAGRRGTQFPNTMYDNQVDYREMLATVFFIMDKRPRIIIEADKMSERQITMYITVKAAEYWYAMPNCVIDIDEDGLPLTIHRDHAYPNALRYDKEKLDFVAACVHEWFSVERQAIKIPVNDYGYGETITCELGVYVKEVKGLVLQKSVNSVVTRLEFDCERDVSLIQTSFVDLDERLNLTETLTQLGALEIGFEGNIR